MLKIEPQAQTEQNVTVFPVLVRIHNEGGLLRPGMNTEVEIHVGQREGVLAVPNAALRTQRDVGSAAQVLGLSTEEVQKELAASAAQAGELGRRLAADPGRGRGADSARRDARDSTRRALPDPAARRAWRDSVRVRGGGAGGLAGGRGGAAGGGQRGFGGAGRRTRGTDAGGGRYIVFVKRNGQPIPVWIRTGLTDLDYSEVIHGLEASDSVYVLPSASLVQSQQDIKQRMNQITGGGGVPGMRQSTSGAPAVRAGAGRRPGAVAMLLGETFAVAISSIRSNALRAVLTMLGIIIGVGAVITMVALGSGAQKAVEDRIAALGANVFTVFAGQGRSGAVMITDRTVLSTDDYEALQRDATLLKAVVPEAQSAQQVVYGNQNRNLQIIGTTANYADVRNYTVPFGRMFSAGDDASRQRYAVLGSAVPEMLGANPAAMIHQTLLIRGIPFEIIGVLSAKGAVGRLPESGRADPDPARRPRSTACSAASGCARCPSRWRTACRSSRAWWTWSGFSGASTTSGPAATTTSPSATSRTCCRPSSRRPRCSPPCSPASRR